jgi:putative flippase GtrA
VKFFLARATRFLGLGGVSFAVNVGLTVLLTEKLHLPPEVSFAIAIVVVFTMNFLACRYFVFDSRSQDFRQQLLRFAMTSGGFRGSEWLALLVCHRLLGIENYGMAIVAILIVSTIVKFFVYQRVVFTGRPVGEPAADRQAGR